MTVATYPPIKLFQFPRMRRLASFWEVGRLPLSHDEQTILASVTRAVRCQFLEVGRLPADGSCGQSFYFRLSASIFALASVAKAQFGKRARWSS
jgi:hypothetical protein